MGRKQNKEIYFSTIYDTLAQTPEVSTWEQERYRLVHHLCETSEFEGNLADVGGGAGLVLTHLDLSRFKQVILMDISKQRIKDARKRITNTNMHFCVADASKIPLATASCDNVLSLEVIEHVNDAQAVIREIKRICKKGAYFVLSTPNKDAKQRKRIGISPKHIKGSFKVFMLLVKKQLSIKEFLLMGKNFLTGRHFTHVREFSYSEMLKSLNQEGFRLIKAYGYHSDKGFSPIDANSSKLTYATMVFLTVSI